MSSRSTVVFNGYCGCCWQWVSCLCGEMDEWGKEGGARSCETSCVLATCFTSHLMGLPLQGPPLFLPVSKSSATTFYEWPTSLDEGRGTQCQGGFDGGGVSSDLGVYVALVAGNDINVCGQQWGWSTGADVGGH